MLPARSRKHLLAFYGFARLTDQLGDDYSGDRLVALDWLESATIAALDGSSGIHPMVADAASSVRDLRMDGQPLFDLIAANRMDQTVHSYPTFDALIHYCSLSANPVGRLVLGAFGHHEDSLLPLADAICTGLQLAEHWQDVSEDARAGRIYLPEEDLARFGVDPADLAGPGPADQALRALMAFEVHRARSWLDRGTPLISALSGRPRLAVAGFVAGGQAALDGIARRDFDPLQPPTRPSAARLVRHLALTARTRPGSPR
jgi:squalene synthase HpnC